MEHLQHTNPGLIGGLASMGRNLFGLLVSRIELATLELSEVRTNLLKLLLMGALGIVAVWFALAFWTGLLVAVTWEAWGWRILLAIAVAFTAMAAGMFYYVKSIVAEGKLSLPATLAELRNDRDALR